MQQLFHFKRFLEVLPSFSKKISKNREKIKIKIKKIKKNNA
jgi:hypothetical protein